MIYCSLQYRFPIPRERYSKALGTTLVVKQVKPYCSKISLSIIHLPFSFVQQVFLSQQWKWVELQWKPTAGVRAVSNHFPGGHVRAVARIRVFDERAASHQPQD